MSKRTERIARAKARAPEETAAIRKHERRRPISSVAQFIAGPNKGKRLVDVLREKGTQIEEN